MNFRKLLSFEINLNIVGARPFLTLFLGSIMSINDEMAKLLESTKTLAAKVEENNDRTDALITIANTTKDALVELQASLPTGGGTPGAPPVDTAAISAAIGEVIATQQKAIDSLKAQETETAAATSAVAP